VATDCIVTLDAGTGSGRCVVFDRHGAPLASAQEPFHYRLLVDPDFPLMRGFDLDPDAFWAALARCARAALAKLPADARLRGVVATSQREGCVLIDDAGGVLYAGPNLDARAALEGLELQEHISAARLHELTGHSPPYIFPIARYLWFRKHHDERRVKTLLMLNDWITYLLSGECGAEHSNAGESMLYDVTRRCWSTEITGALGIPAAILPPLRATGDRIGSVTARAAAATGIPEGTPVLVGGADTESALLGSGAFAPGQTGAVLGTTTPVQMVTDRPILDPQANLWTSCHVVSDRWVLESNAGDTGSAYRWLLDLVYGSADAAAHAAAEEAVSAIGTPAHRVLSYLGPVVFNLAEVNPFRPAGVFFPFPLLHFDRPSRADLLHAFFENVAYAVRGNCEQVVAVAGQPVAQLWVSGGMTRSPTLTRLLASTLGIPMAVAAVTESASLGCAILAAVSIGLEPDLPTAVANMTRTVMVEPETAAVTLHEERYQKWRSAYATLKTWTV
jgi:autoinducer 2 (AI-2) kinase